MAVPIILPLSCSSLRLPSTRRREMVRRAATLPETRTMPMAVSTGSYWKRMTAKKTIITALMLLLASSRDSSWATRSLMPTRLLISPA